MNTYGYSKLSIKELGDDLTPKTGSELIVIEGEKKKGATTTFDLTGLTKEPVKVFGSNIEYFLARKGTGSVAANFGLLDVPAAVEKTILGLVTLAEGIDGFGENTEPPYVAAVAESEDLYGEPVAFAMVAGSFNRDAFSLATKNDEDFTPEPGEYVYNSISRKIKIGTTEETVKVLRAYGEEAVTQLKTVVLGTTTP
ncbi:MULTISPECIES: major tail protein [unclassified Enterococcus]|uniref:major tail protein n=1 Tax=unclassified Enterococcus TaxID=2608891 RepID=UPI001555BB8F|nr:MULTISPECIES: major tail protein [unclassified Enterococcus]MBS7578292.1 phage tail protein [Enterococcus sp. MMGLQ5-2]MBS7585497.1 phage tail protein [Enterococcus sp. MMGLQ5-1]NPD13354.1 phage tail protein [Enterococcus sp. MMGLQ5-1]NPD38123.1 phage tail protein [Enterococcus sp. MMGLQ5-2]